jgi:hydroxymethylbilane synthase
LAPDQGAPGRKIVLGTRGSDLALAQTRMVESTLREKWQIDVQLEIIRTRGDEAIISNETDRAAGRKGIFTAALERALVEKRIDVAVHSAKDLPSALESTLAIDAVLARGMVEDLLLRKDASDTAPMTIATGSVRRQRQARWSNPKAHIVPLRGNVPTRLRKFIENEWDAIILARAGLERLGFLPPEFEFEGHKFFAEILPTETFLPAGGQGIIALQTREADFPVRQVISSIDDRDTHLCLRTEREFLRLLQGDCDLPVGVHARFVNGELELRAQVFENEPAPKTAMERGGDPEKLAADVFRQIEQRDG